MQAVFRRFKTYFNPLPRKEGDSNSGENRKAVYNFNPLPRKEGDIILLDFIIQGQKFQSTPS